MEVSHTFNPTVLFNLLVGASGAAGRRNPGPILTSIRNDLRKEIEAALPVIYLYDAEVIVDSMLASLNVSAIQASQKLSQEESLAAVGRFVSGVSSPEGLVSLPQIQVKGSGKSKTQYVVPGNEGAYSAYIEAYNRLVSNRQSLVNVVHTAITNEVKDTTKVSTVVTALADIHARLNAAVVKITELGLPISSKQSQKFTRVIRAAGRSIRNFSNKVKKFEDAETLVDGYSPNSMVLVYAQNFNSAKTRINKSITTHLAKELSDNFNITTNSNDSGFKAGNFSAAGHVGFISDTIQNINTPQLQAANILLASASKEAPGLTNRFIQNTGHAEWLINIKKEYGEQANKLVELGISFVRSQPFYLNSGALSTAESALINKEINEVLNASYKESINTLKDLASQNTQFHNYLIDTYRSSPTLKENISSIVEAAIRGITIPKGKSKRSGTTKKNKRVSGNMGTLGSGGRKLKPKKSLPPQGISVPPSAAAVNLTSLQTIINNALHDTLKNNMGTGTSKNVLNYRSGEFANSVEVVSISQSRQNMLSIYYTYMKYPYATFSQGGKQEKPRSRDPKLLISKSIREIAQQHVANRMRAVLL